MKIHRWSPWLRRHHTWAPFTLFMVSAAVACIADLAHEILDRALHDPAALADIT